MKWRCELSDNLEISSRESSVLCWRKLPMHGKCLGHQDRIGGRHIGDMMLFGVAKELLEACRIPHRWRCHKLVQWHQGICKTTSKQLHLRMLCEGTP